MPSVISRYATSGWAIALRNRWRRVMAAFVVLGVVGVGLHYNGNVEFERELHPDEHGWEFIRKTVAGATPVLAPGSMVLLGLIGLAHAYHHPQTRVIVPEIKV